MTNFTDEMTAAILDGRKTMHREMVKFENGSSSNTGCGVVHVTDSWLFVNKGLFVGCPHKIGDIIPIGDIKLRITAVRAERLHEISNEDCAKEGITSEKLISGIYWFRRNIWEQVHPNVHARESWYANPWVWVYTFEVVE